MFQHGMNDDPEIRLVAFLGTSSPDDKWGNHFKLTDYFGVKV